jgi:hypothetical protein
MINILAKILIAPIIFVMSLAGYSVPLDDSANLGSYYTVGAKNYYLGGAGVSGTDTSIALTSFTIPVSGADLTMTNFGEIGFATIDPSSPTRQEFISFTGITQNVDGTATLTGVSRGLLPVYPYTTDNAYKKAHPGGSVLIISNSPQVYNEFAAKKNTETISGAWTFNATSTFSSTTLVSTTPTTDTMVANKLYVDTQDTATLATATSTAGGYITALKAANNIWSGTNIFNATSTFASTTFNGLANFVQNLTIPLLPIANSDAASKEYVDTTVAAGVPISNHTTTGAGRTAISSEIASGYSSTTPYFIPSSLASSTASSTAIVVSTLAGTGKIDTSFISNLVAYAFSTTTTFGGISFEDQKTKIEVFDASGTWTKATGAKVVEVIAIGAGGGGGTGYHKTAAGNQVAGGSGGGGGAITKKIMRASDLAATVAVTVASAPASDNPGGSSSFGTHLVAYGGGQGSNGTISGASGGSGGGSAGAGVSGNNSGDVIGGSPATTAAANGISGQGGGSDIAGAGKNAEFGGGGGGGGEQSGDGLTGGSSLFCGGGGGGGGGMNGSDPGSENDGVAGGKHGAYTAGGGGAGGAAGGTAGTAGTSRSGYGCGDGGGGGGSKNTGTAGAGGAGGAPGGGGGGGGASAVGGTSGAGGAGGRGEVIVITYF